MFRLGLAALRRAASRRATPEWQPPGALAGEPSVG